MNNVWTSIVLRSHCTVRSQRKPLLQLFNGYAKSQSRIRRCYAEPSPKTCRQTLWQPSRTFSSTSYMPARRKDKRVRPPETQPLVPESKAMLEPAPTVASHTEGLPLGEDALTWRDYDPEGGMPLPNGELSQPEINAVFSGDRVDVDTGNYVVSVMHWRRLSGSLIDMGLDFPKDSGVTRGMALKGLQYVRSIASAVDEVATGQQWAEEESQRLQAEIQARAVKLRIYKPDIQDGVPPEETPEEVQQGTEYGRQRSGESVLQATREANEAEWEQTQAQRAVADQIASNSEASTFRGPLELGAGVQPMIQRVDGNRTITTKFPSGVSIRPPNPKAWLRPVQRKPWVKYYEEQATVIKDNVIPQLSNSRRFGPPLVVVLSVLASCYYLSQNYTPPPKSARAWPDTPPAVATLYALTSVLVATFLLGRLPPLWKTYSKYMVLVPVYPYALSVIGATFRHDRLLHLASNLTSLWLFGLLLHDDVGRGTFLAIYLASGVFGAYSSLVYNALRKQWTAYILGSSGCVLGVVSAACALRPNGTVKAFGYEVPIAAWLILALFAGGEAFAAIRGLKTTIDHAGHLGGITIGVGSGLMLRRRAGEKDSKHDATVQGS